MAESFNENQTSGDDLFNMQRRHTQSSEGLLDKRNTADAKPSSNFLKTYGHLFGALWFFGLIIIVAITPTDEGKVLMGAFLVIATFFVVTIVTIPINRRLMREHKRRKAQNAERDKHNTQSNQHSYAKPFEVS